ncbi:peptide-methionine (S)-S-oxide reductase MsrA [Egicoccus halophilus]|uniref:Peptide methionine sulfoxide reductase MsrA n=1 Tax=Egicoccus halophilus TaxID=1670830 RepID=A0A8J3A6M7_9ACTN|nr:peptide-methionine (S)-S-oxide reductase MsrA [Egicoccus halophilus]GGI04649.1 peptide methionine sulfoxide reductase MsrA [Egicoccus halophilus]
MWFGDRSKSELVRAEDAHPGREAYPFSIPDAHHVHGRSLTEPWPAGHEVVVFGMGCYWGAERIFWPLPGVHTTAVAYAGGFTPHPTYREVCTGRTGHAEVVVVVFDPAVIDLDGLLGPFWENHDPTQGMRQGNDVGTQYRSAIYTTSEEQAQVAEASRVRYQAKLAENGYGEITTEIAPLGTWFYAEPEHQQYLAKNPGGYCNHGFCQVGYTD